MIRILNNKKLISLIFLFFIGINSQGQQNKVNGNLIQFSSSGAWCWYQDERAVVDAANNKLIIASNRTSNGHNYVDIFDITAGTTANYDLGFIGSDDHNTPALFIRPDGKYLAMYAGHNGNKLSYYRIFNNGAWGSQQTYDWNTQPGGADFNTTYSNLHYFPSKDTLYNIARGNGHGGQNFIYSTDQGNTWAYGGLLTNNANVGYVNGYFKYCDNGADRIDFICTEYHPRDYNTGIYHGYIKNGKTFKSDGTLVDDNIFDKNPSTPQSYTPVFAANTIIDSVEMTHCWNTDVQVYNDGTIATIITARTNNNFNDPTHCFIYCRYNGSDWNYTFLGNAGKKLYSSEEDYTGLAAMHTHNPNIIYISSTFDPRDGSSLAKHEIFKGITLDNGSSWSWIPVTENSTMDNLRPIVPAWDSIHTVLIWLRGTYTTAQNISTAIVGIITENENEIPVELSSFTAAADLNSVELKWETKTETNNRGFEIERYANGKWHMIGFAEGKGTTTGRSKYKFIEKNVNGSNVRYRLKQIDFDGTFTYSKEVEINLIQEYQLNQNYPNPFNPATTIRYSIPSKSIVNLEVYDIMGNKIAVLVNEEKSAGRFAVSFDGSNFSSGIYYYRIKAGNFVKVGKMILLK
ncbi:MAG: T9SS type A sorting domain-containing protein [Ignavibacteria bacterium]